MNSISLPFSVRSVGLAAVCLAIFAAQPALARERQGSVTGPQGKTATHDVSRAQGNVSSSTTNAQGKTLASRGVERNAGSTQGTVTGPQGQSTTRETTRNADGADTTVTGPKGQTGTVSVTR